MSERVLPARAASAIPSSHLRKGFSKGYKYASKLKPQHKKLNHLPAVSRKLEMNCHETHAHQHAPEHSEEERRLMRIMDGRTCLSVLPAHAALWTHFSCSVARVGAPEWCEQMDLAVAHHWLAMPGVWSSFGWLWQVERE
jgi:hypothetical protein